MKRVTAIAGCLLLAGMLGGCSDDVTVYEPGVYKGKTDPLLEKVAQDEFKEELRERVKLVQGAE